MLSIIILFAIGRYFYKLAEAYKQNKWIFAILGVISYYAGAFAGGIILGVLDEVLGLGFDWDNNLLLTLVAIPFGLGTMYLFYFLLKKNWKKTVVEEKNEIQDIGKQLED
jgi:phosphotransferase system  glucose/maltose/N-acetylglucosamine-specific IIC component